MHSVNSVSGCVQCFLSLKCLVCLSLFSNGLWCLFCFTQVTQPKYLCWLVWALTVSCTNQLIFLNVGKSLKLEQIPMTLASVFGYDVCGGMPPFGPYHLNANSFSHIYFHGLNVVSRIAKCSQKCFVCLREQWFFW